MINYETSTIYKLELNSKHIEFLEFILNTTPFITDYENEQKELIDCIIKIIPNPKNIPIQ